ncbi:MAG: DUF167 domain-containing protein [Chloroflexi bacterium]|nr:MAG: hypothetical protein CUN54_03180 [Phototrophicales bacterium]RMF82295.1 MAG: DUF167 domain-containing protein [Chloroflexota bacterium]
MSMKRNFKITDAKSGAAFTVRVVTRASTTEIGGVHDDGALKVRLQASPAGDPAANQELIDFLAGQLDVAPDRIEIVAGENTRDKLISVEGILTDELEARLGITFDS